MTISLNIDVSKIDKARIKEFTRKDGTVGKSYSMVVFVNDQPDQFGNNGMIIESVPKDSATKGAILGNCKILGKPAPAPVSDHVPDAPGAEDDLPF